MAVLNLVDILARTNADPIKGLVEDVLTMAPEFMVVPATPRAGTSYRVTRRTGYPSGGFRAVNDANAPGKSTYVQSIKEMFFLDYPLQIDEAIVQADDGSAGDLLTQEQRGAFESMMMDVGSQFYYGTDSDAAGFAGLKSQCVYSLAAGSTTNTTSAYLVWLDERGVRFDVGRSGNLSLAPWSTQVVSVNSGNQRAYVSNLSGYIGLSVSSEYSVYRVKGIDMTSKLTDALGLTLLAQVPMARRNNLRWFMNRTAHTSLQLSRSVTTYVGAGADGSPASAPAPTTLGGVPITVTDSLVDTETAVNTSGPGLGE
jgi:hypothetical protein